MTEKIIAAPSLLAADLSNLGLEIDDAERCGANWLHIDVMDGRFVPPITFGDNIVRAVKKHSSLFCDVHLMIENPERQIELFAKAGSDRLIIHQEVCPHAHRILNAISEAGMKNGIAINPGTPPATVESVLEVCDLVLVMTVNPGWGGQKFIGSCLGKISWIKDRIEALGVKTLIEVDGGINAETARLCVQAGADVLVAGSFVFGAKDRKKSIAALHGASLST